MLKNWVFTTSFLLLFGAISPAFAKDEALSFSGNSARTETAAVKKIPDLKLLAFDPVYGVAVFEEKNSNIVRINKGQKILNLNFRLTKVFPDFVEIVDESGLQSRPFFLRRDDTLREKYEEVLLDMAEAGKSALRINSSAMLE